MSKNNLEPDNGEQENQEIPFERPIMIVLSVSLLTLFIWGSFDMWKAGYSKPGIVILLVPTVTYLAYVLYKALANKL